MGSLPVQGGASFFNGGGAGSTGRLTTSADFYGWLNGSIINTLFQDAVCGDGVCNTPEEVAAVGRFGWCAARSARPDPTFRPRVPPPSPHAASPERIEARSALGPRPRRPR